MKIISKIKNKITYAFVRKDILEAGETVPTHKGGQMPEEYLHRTFVCKQPERISDEEFNLILYNNETKKEQFRCCSIDFEFFTGDVK